MDRPPAHSCHLKDMTWSDLVDPLPRCAIARRRGGAMRVARPRRPGRPSELPPPPARQNGGIEPSMQARAAVEFIQAACRSTSPAPRCRLSPGSRSMPPVCLLQFCDRLGIDLARAGVRAVLDRGALLPSSGAAPCTGGGRDGRFRDYRDHRPRPSSALAKQANRSSSPHLGPSGRPQEARTKPRSVPPSPCQPPVVPSGALFWRRKYAGGPTVGKGRGCATPFGKVSPRARSLAPPA